MPNWCSNTLTITKGVPSVVLDAIRTEHSLFDFNTLIPTPREIADAYHWSIQNWGTKWNSASARYSATSPHNTIHFDTAWAPPVPVFEALAERFPEHEFTIRSLDEYMLFHYKFLLKDGEFSWRNEPCVLRGIAATDCSFRCGRSH
jgi:hypothetical protein